MAHAQKQKRQSDGGFAQLTSEVGRQEQASHAAAYSAYLTGRKNFTPQRDFFTGTVTKL
jgi:hypothetical protein